MSSGHFHVHGPHDHEVEHAAMRHTAHAEVDGLPQKVAMMTAILAFCGAISSWQGSTSLSEAMLLKNESILLKNQSVLKKTEASNQWNYYQAKSSKQNLSELAVELAPESRRPFYQDEVKRYKTEKAEVMAEAQKLDKESTEWDRKSDEQMHQHHRWAQATTALQIAIAMAAIALLTRKRWLEYAVFGVSAVGMALGAAAWFHY